MPSLLASHRANTANCALDSSGVLSSLEYPQPPDSDWDSTSISTSFRIAAKSRFGSAMHNTMQCNEMSYVCVGTVLRIKSRAFLTRTSDGFSPALNNANVTNAVFPQPYPRWPFQPPLTGPFSACSEYKYATQRLMEASTWAAVTALC